MASDLTSNTSIHVIQDHAAHTVKKIATLVESMGYAPALTPNHQRDLEAALIQEYKAPPGETNERNPAFTRSIFRSSTATAAARVVNDSSETPSPVALFLDWLGENVTAQTNWPEFKPSPTSVMDALESDHDILAENHDLVLKTLDREHAQLWNTLASLEQELTDLQSLEAESIDTGRTLDMDIHDASVEYDSTIQKLHDLAQEMYSKYDPTFLRDGNPTGSREFLYQCQRELEQLSEVDEQLLAQATSIQEYIMINTTLDPSTSEPEQHQRREPHTVSLFHKLFQQNPAQDKELMRLCSIYRATKMSHIRAMAQLQSLEEQVRYMTELDTQLRLQEKENDEEESREGDLLTGDAMYTIASKKNRMIQQTRQHEIELITVHREKSRLTDELEQLLSEPSGQRVYVQGAEEELDPTRRGVLVDICERIARTDIELQYLAAAHQDHVQAQESALQTMHAIVNHLIEYYSHCLVVEKALRREQDRIREHKDILWALVQELESSSSTQNVGQVMETDQHMNDGHSSMTTTTNDRIMAEETAVVTKTLFSALQNHLTLQAQARREQDVLVENVNQLLRAKSMLLNNVVHQHSATAQPCFEPRNVQEAKEDLVERIQSARQECTKLEDQMNKEMIR